MRARSPNGDDFHRMVESDLVNRQAIVDSRDVGEWRNLKRVAMVLQQSWAISFLRIESVSVEGPKARIIFQEPERRHNLRHVLASARPTVKRVRPCSRDTTPPD